MASTGSISSTADDSKADDSSEKLFVSPRWKFPEVLEVKGNITLQQIKHV